MLLIQMSEMERKMAEFDKQSQMTHLEQQKNATASMQRPSTSAGAFMRKKEDLAMTNEDFLLSETA